MWEKSGMNKRLFQLFLLVILGAGALIVIFIVARLFITPPDYLPPTINPLVPSVNLSITVTESRQAIVLGTTDMPEETIFEVSVVEENGNFSHQSEVIVVDGSFQSEQFGGEMGLNFGSYRVDVQTAIAAEQPEAVRERLGLRGVNLVGDFVFHEAGESTVKTTARFEVSIPPPVLHGCFGEGIGQTRTDLTSGFELTLQAAYVTREAYGIVPSKSTNEEYNNEFMFVEIVFRNIDNKPRYISYDRFVLFIDEGFAFADINIPFTFYPDAKFTVNPTAKDDGFFGIMEVKPGESLVGRIAFMVPDIARRFVLSNNASNCYEQDAALQCFPEYPYFIFND